MDVERTKPLVKRRILVLSLGGVHLSQRFLTVFVTAGHGTEVTEKKGRLCKCWNEFSSGSANTLGYLIQCEDFMLHLLFAITAQHSKMSWSYSSYSGHASIQPCETTLFFYYSGSPCHAYIAPTAEALAGLGYMKFPNWKTVETRWEDWTRNWFAVSSGGKIYAWPELSQEVCLDWGAFIGPAAQMHSSAGACVCVALQGRSDIYWRVKRQGSFTGKWMINFICSLKNEKNSFF